MKKVNLNTDQLRGYINAAFNGDSELIEIYDKTVQVKNIEEVCINVYEKIISLEGAVIRGVEIEGIKAGYFVFTPGILTSFGLAVKFRTEPYLKCFWEIIKKEIGETFMCALFDYNKRAVNFLKKQGMKTIFENVIILSCH